MKLFGEYHVEDAIKIIKDNESDDGYVVAFSGGKDSCVIWKLCELAGVKYKLQYKSTGIDPPEVVKFIKTLTVEWISPDVRFFKKMQTEGFPTRLNRWCCRYLKEDNPPGSVVITGVRVAESVNRKRRGNDIVLTCFEKNKTTIRPIVNWTDIDVWDFIKEYRVPYCELYDQGFKRIGCIGCPNDRSRRNKFARYPKYEALWIRSFKILYNNKPRLQEAFKDHIDMWEWYIGDKPTREKY